MDHLQSFTLPGVRPSNSGWCSIVPFLAPSISRKDPPIYPIRGSVRHDMTLEACYGLRGKRILQFLFA